jgi:hypothetical protein
MSGQKNLFERLSALDRRVLFAVMMIIQAITLMVPLGLPTVLEPMVKDAYDRIEATPTDGVIFVGFECAPGMWSEQKPPVLALMRHVISRQLKFIGETVTPDAPPLWEELMADLKPDLDANGYVYGEDYAWCGFFAGTASAVISLAQDFDGMVTADAYGTPTSQLPIFQGLETIDDFNKEYSLLLGGCGQGYYYLENMAANYGARFVFCPTGKCAVDYLLYYTGGYFKGVIGGLIGGAQYEKLIGRLGAASSQNDMISISVLTNFVFLLLGNIAHYGSRRKR